MVVFHLETTKDADFLYETQCSSSLTDVIEDVVGIHNCIKRILCIVGMLKDLIKNGPMEENGERHNPPTENVEILNRAIADAEAAVSPDWAKKKVFFTPERVSEALAHLSGAITIVYPQGLPPTEPIRKVLEGGDVEGEYDPKTCQLWWARKSLLRGKPVSEFLGNNERVTAVAKLTDAKSGPPPKDMSMSQDAQIKLMSKLHKQAEEYKKMEKDDDDSYLDSQWANPHTLKNQFQGIQDLDFKPH